MSDMQYKVSTKNMNWLLSSLLIDGADNAEQAVQS